MAFYTRDQIDKPIDRLYLFDIVLPSGMKVVKIGKSSGKSSLDRMLQIQRDYYNKNRSTFICHIKRDRPIEEDVFKYEAELHRFFKDYQYTPKVVFDGSTECFCVYIDAAVEAMEYLLDNGLGSLDEFEYDPEVYTPKEDSLPF